MATHSRKTPLDRSIGLRIRAFRQALRWSQAELAERLGITAAAVSHWESGRIEPRPPHLRALARTFGIRAEVLSGEYLVGGSDEKAARELEAVLLRLLDGGDALREALERFASTEELVAWLKQYAPTPKRPTGRRRS